MLSLSSELKELHCCWEGGRGGSFWLGFVQEEPCEVSQPGTLLSPIWAGIFGRAALGAPFFAMDDQPEAAAGWSHRGGVVKELLLLWVLYDKTSAWGRAGGHWDVPGTAAPSVGPAWVGRPSLGSRDTSQSLRCGGPITAGCSCRNFVCC